MIGAKTPTGEELLAFLYLTPVGVVKFRADGTVDLMNPLASALLLSIAPPASLDNLYAALVPLEPKLRDTVSQFAAQAGTVIDQRWLNATAGGREITLSLTVNKIGDGVFMAVIVDVTRLADQERRLLADGQKFFAIFDNVRGYAIYPITTDGLVEEWNQSLERCAGWLEPDVRDRSMSLFFPPDDPERPRLEELLSEAREAGSAETEGWHMKRDGTRFWGNTVITALPDATGKLRGFVVVSRDITERKLLEDKMSALATIDPLTGAYNRRQFDPFLAREFGRRARSGQSFALLMMDVDGFKAVNDRYGHPAGDAVLIALVAACRATLRVVDILVRWGGEEFVVILPEADASAAMIVAERLRAALAATAVSVAGCEPIHTTISIGVAVPKDNDPDALLSRSDGALYAAKDAGRNRVMLAP